MFELTDIKLASVDYIAFYDAERVGESIFINSKGETIHLFLENDVCLVSPKNADFVRLFFNNSVLRLVIGTDERFWFVARDVARALGLLDWEYFLEYMVKHNPELMDTYIIDTPGWKQEVSIINEAGLRYMINQSGELGGGNNSFIQWVNTEALPCLCEAERAASQ